MPFKDSSSQIPPLLCITQMYTGSDVWQPTFLGSVFPKEWESGTNNPDSQRSRDFWCLAAPCCKKSQGFSSLWFQRGKRAQTRSGSSLAEDRFYRNNCQHIQPLTGGGSTTHPGFKMTCTDCGPQFHLRLTGFLHSKVATEQLCATAHTPLLSTPARKQKQNCNCYSLMYSFIYKNTNATHG